MNSASSPVPARMSGAAIAAALVRWRWRWLAAGLVLALMLSAGLIRLDIRHDYRLFIDKADPELAIADRLRARTAGGREQLIIIYRPASGRVFESTSLLQLAKLADQASRFPHVESVQSLVTATKLVRRADAGPNENPRTAWAVVPFIHPDGLFEPDGLARLSRDAAALPGIAGRLVSARQETALVLLAADLGTGSRDRQDRLSAILAALDKTRVDVRGLRAGDRVEMVGAPMFDRALSRILEQDAQRLAPAAILIYFLLLYLLFRSVRLALVVLLVVVVASAAAVGTVALAGVTTTILVFSGVLLVATLAVAEALHVISGHVAARLDGADPAAAMTHSLAHNFWPIATTSLTTAVGEAVLLFSTSPAVTEMGIVMIVGAVLALVFTLCFVPALVMLVPVRRASGFHHLQPAMGRLAALCGRHPRRVLLASAIVAGLILPGLARMHLADSMPGWFNPRTEFRQGLDTLSSGYAALGSLTVATPVDEGLRNAGARFPQADAALDRQARLDGQLAGLPGIRSVVGPAVLHRALEQRMAGASPGQSSLILPGTVIAEAPSRSRPSPAMLENPGLATPAEAGRQDFLIRTLSFRGSSNADILMATGQVRSTLANGGVAGSEAGGLAVVFANLGDSNMASTGAGTAATALAITMCLAFAFRSLRLAGISLLPNLMPVLLVFGLWGWFAGTINLAATTVLSVALGIVVDDTTHIFMRHRRLTRSGLSPAAASEQTIREVGPAITVTSIVLATGFFLLGQSDFALTAQQANMIGASILMAVLFDLTATAALLGLGKPARSDGEPVSRTQGGTDA